MDGTRGRFYPGPPLYFLMYWFQVPAILIGLGKTITVTDFNLFFALTLPITFLALILVYVGILQIADFAVSRRRKVFLFSWFALAILFFAYYFVSQRGIINTYALPLVGNIAFYFVIRVLILAAAVRLAFRSELQNSAGIIGISGLVIEAVLGLMRNVFIVWQVLHYPPQFWYVVISGSRFFFVTQAMSVILLSCSFLALHYAYHRLKYGLNYKPG